MRLITAAAVAIVLAVPTLARAQSLPEAAKQAEEAHAKAAANPAKVYTNRDLKDSAGNLASPAAPRSSDQKTAPAATLPEPTETDRQTQYHREAKKDESYWKDRMQGLRTKFEADTLQLVAITARIKTLDGDLDRTPSSSQRAVLRSEREAAATELARLTAVVATDKSLISTAEEEAHFANVPPGWLRQGPSR
jgi:hypothetical protein